jgi:hypothetical protein
MENFNSVCTLLGAKIKKSGIEHIAVVNVKESKLNSVKTILTNLRINFSVVGEVVTMKCYHVTTIQEAEHYIDSLTLDNVKSGRCYIGLDGWCNVTFSDEFKEEFFTQCAKLMVKKQETVESIVSRLSWCKNIGLFERFLLDRGGVSYCAGQDYTYELRIAKNHILKS